MEVWKCGRMEVWKDGSVEGWEDGRMEGMSLSEPRIQGRRSGWMEGWKDGCGEGWKGGRMEEGRMSESRITRITRITQITRKRGFSYQISCCPGCDIVLSEPRITQITRTKRFWDKNIHYLPNRYYSLDSFKRYTFRPANQGINGMNAI